MERDEDRTARLARQGVAGKFLKLFSGSSDPGNPAPGPPRETAPETGEDAPQPTIPARCGVSVAWPAETLLAAPSATV
jgi:hypothetical protein